MSPSDKTRPPQLRLDLEYMPVTFKDQDAFLIYDPLGILEESVLIQGPAVTILKLIDGQRTMGQIQSAMKQGLYGPAVSEYLTSQVMAELDERLVLENKRVQEKRGRLVRDYAALKVRPAAHAGQTYPADRRALGELLDRILDQALPPARTPGRIKAVVAPHIDLEAGKQAYGRIYGLLRECPPPHTVVALGTGHDVTSGYFSLTTKDFETPFGLVKTDRKTVRALALRAGRAAEPHDFSHRREHSLEMELIFLQHVFGSDFRLVPILCGSFQNHLAGAKRAVDIPAVAPVLDFLREFLDRAGQDVLVVAGVDLSHIGYKYGHEHCAAFYVSETQQQDKRLIEALCRRDALAFWKEVSGINDMYNVCGFSSLACLLEIFPADWPSGRAVHYGIRRDEVGASTVTFAAIAYDT